MTITLESLTRSARARQLGIDNTPPESALVLFPAFREKILGPLCEQFGTLAITSGYRCPALNAAISKAANSDHQWDEFGIAADITILGKDLRIVYDWIRLEGWGVPFDQCILEHDKGTGLLKCIHISYRPNPRRMAMRGGTFGSTKYEHDVVKDAEDAG